MNDNFENKLDKKIEPEKDVDSTKQNMSDVPPIDKKGVESTNESFTEDPYWKALKEDPNWKAMREARKKDKEQREVAERRARDKEEEAAALKQAMDAILAKGQYATQQNTTSTYQEEETEEARITRKVDERLAQREAAYEREREERERQEYPQRLVKNYSDFNAIVTEDNLDYLEYHYPEVASLIKKQPDNYDKWVDTYKAVKKLVPNSQNAKKDAARLESNYNKPKSISFPNITPTGSPAEAHRISEERKAANWARMQKQLKGIS